MFFLTSVRSRLVGYIAVVCTLVVILQLRALSVRDKQRVPEQDTVEDEIPYQNETLASTTPTQPHEDTIDTKTMSDAWRKGFTVDKFNDLFESWLESCNSGLPCPENTDKLVILDWHHFAHLLYGVSQGENIWCGSMIDSIHKLGYSMLISNGEKNLSYIFRKYHKNVQLIIRNEARDCVDDPRCIYVDAGPSTSSLVPAPNSTHLNLPIWKVFHAMWWNAAVEPLGGPFTLSPEPYKMWPWQFHGWNNYYLGYSVEPTCLSTPFVPWTERPRQAFMMGKYLGYFLAPQYVLTDPVGGGPAQMADDFYQKFSEEENTTFIAGQFDLYMSRGYTKPPPGIVQQPRLQREAFQKLIAQSRVMVGIGNSLLSPTPYEALCLGIPFINPVFEWNKDDPEDRRFWQTQHEALTVEGLDEPYVYHVKRGDREGFKAAIKKAMNTPIARFVPPRMTTSAVLERMKTLLETDWRAMAKQQMEATGYSGPRPDTDDFRD